MPDQTSIPYGVRNKIGSMQAAISGADWVYVSSSKKEITVKGFNLWIVLFAMSGFVFGDAGECWASRQTLEKITGLSDATIERAQNAAVTYGFCKLGKEKKRIGKNLYPVYVFTLGWLEQIETDGCIHRAWGPCAQCVSAKKSVPAQTDQAEFVRLCSQCMTNEAMDGRKTCRICLEPAERAYVMGELAGDEDETFVVTPLPEDDDFSSEEVEVSDTDGLD